MTNPSNKPKSLDKFLTYAQYLKDAKERGVWYAKESLKEIEVNKRNATHPRT